MSFYCIINASLKIIVLKSKIAQYGLFDGITITSSCEELRSWGYIVTSGTETIYWSQFCLIRWEKKTLSNRVHKNPWSVNRKFWGEENAISYLEIYWKRHQQKICRARKTSPGSVAYSHEFGRLNSCDSITSQCRTGKEADSWPSSAYEAGHFVNICSLSHSTSTRIKCLTHFHTFRSRSSDAARKLDSFLCSLWLSVNASVQRFSPLSDVLAGSALHMPCQLPQKPASKTKYCQVLSSKWKSGMFHFLSGYVIAVTTAVMCQRLSLFLFRSCSGTSESSSMSIYFVYIT